MMTIAQIRPAYGPRVQSYCPFWPHPLIPPTGSHPCEQANRGSKNIDAGIFMKRTFWTTFFEIPNDYQNDKQKQSSKSPPTSVVNYSWKTMRGVDNRILNSVNIVHWTGTFNDPGSSLLISAPLSERKQCWSFKVVKRGLHLPHFRKGIVSWNKISSYACWIAPTCNWRNYKIIPVVCH